MAKRKTFWKPLGDAHLRAIGLVASRWAALESSLLWTIAEVAGISYTHAIILAGAQNASAWGEMLQKLTLDTKLPNVKMKPTDLDLVVNRINELQSKRNGIVHGHWQIRDHLQGLLALVTAPPPKGSEKIKAVGIPKRGKKLIVEYEYTSREIRVIAEEIEEAESDLRGWGRRWLERRKKEGELQLLLATLGQPKNQPAQATPQ